MEFKNYVNRVRKNFVFFRPKSLKYSKIRISTGYGENTRPIIGFSLLQPQNDPKKCLYLLVSHSSIFNYKKKADAQKKTMPDITLNKSYRKSIVENELNKIGNLNETRIL